jgi:hypothetical protein
MRVAGIRCRQHEPRSAPHPCSGIRRCQRFPTRCPTGAGDQGPRPSPDSPVPTAGTTVTTSVLHRWFCTDQCPRLHRQCADRAQPQDDTPVCSSASEGPPRLCAMTARHRYSATCPHRTAPRTLCDRRRPRLSRRCSHSPSCDHRTALPTQHAIAGCRQMRKPFRCSSRHRGRHPGYARRSTETGPGMASGAEATRGPGGPVCPANPGPWRMVCRHVPDGILCAHAQTTEGGSDGAFHPHSPPPAPR